MTKVITTFLLISSLLFVWGCGGKKITTTYKVSNNRSLQETAAGENPFDIDGILNSDSVDTIVVSTKDASIAKEEAVHETLRHRDSMRAKAAESQGFKMSWTAVDKSITVATGDTEPTIITMTDYLPNIEYRPEVEFGNPLPLEPSKHPVWGFATDFARSLTYGILGWKGLDVIGDLAMKTTNSFGDNSNIDGSFNRAGGDQQIFTGSSQYQYQGDYTGAPEVPEEGEGIDGECWVDFPGGCSCESFEAGNCTPAVE